MADVNESETGIGGPLGYTSDEWSTALRVLTDLLRSNKGSASSIAVARELKRNHGVSDPRPLILGLTYVDNEDLKVRGLEIPSVAFHHLGRSFFTEDKYREAIRQAEAETEREAEDASRSAADLEPEDEAPPSRVNRQEEARLTTYVKRALDELYQSEYASSDCTLVFDVHSERAGTSFENVDILAVHWRSGTVVDLITVEVKLDFVPQAVQQALNYLRFSNRVWIAVPVSSDPPQAAIELRDKDPQLFEYVISNGIGILACHRRPGRSYNVFPIQWPSWRASDLVERERFAERYRERLEDAGVLERGKKRFFPSLR
jgi:hypothetical protein